MQDRDAVYDLVDAALKTAQEKNFTLDVMREAILARDNTAVITLAKKLCGLENFDIPKKQRHRR